MDEKYNGLVARPYNARGDYAARVRGDKRTLDYVQGSLIPMTIALDNAQSLKEFGFAGDCIYLDRLSTGSVRFALDSAWPVRFPLGPNDKVTGVPFKQLLLEWDAQPGKIARVWTGYGIEITPALGAISTLDSITNPVGVQGPRSLANVPVLTDLPILARDIGFFYSSSFKSAAAIGANSTEQVFAAASNPNGAILWYAQSVSQVSGAAVATLVHLNAHTSAPAAFTDGDVLLSNYSSAPTLAGEIGKQIQRERPAFIPAGKGLWFRNSTSSGEGGNSSRSALYTIF